MTPRVGTGPVVEPTARVRSTPDPGGGPVRRWSWRGATTAAFVTTLVRPVSWAYGLLGFLVGGGLIVLAWPILVLPTPTGLQNDLGTPVDRLVLGTPSAELVLLAALAVLAVLALVVIATWIGAWAERRGIVLALEAAGEEDVVAPAIDLEGGPGSGRITIIRLLALVPVAVALVLAWGPLYDAGYRELVLPNDLVTPLPIRVLGDVPGQVLGILGAWLVSDAAAAIAVRRLVLERRSLPAAWLLGWLGLVRHPLRAVVATVVGLGTMILLTGPALLASAAGWTRVRDVMLQGVDPWAALVVVAVWVATWLATLVLAGVAAAVRAAAWTFAVAPGRHVEGTGHV